MEFDSALPRYIDMLRSDDVFIITADNGNDPTTPSTDHAREYVPVLARGKGRGKNLGIRESFADVGETIAEFLGMPPVGVGRSFLELINN